MIWTFIVGLVVGFLIGVLVTKFVAEKALGIRPTSTNIWEEPSRLRMTPSGHTYYVGERHYCQEKDCPARVRP
jgi:hypothetical protein